ncbi:hypothetical protein MBLNU457_5067t1 [Dothideomycetes sp. NU457]
MHSSRLLTPTTFVPRKQDRYRYSWQSIQDDVPNRPRIHVIKIVSNTATASAGLPGGEAFGFSISPGGRRVVCYNSSRLFILQTAALPVNISQEYALRRRPLAVEVVDEGGTLAVLADAHTVNVYDLSHHRVHLLKTFKTDYPAHALALSATGGLLAAAYEGGVEIFSLDPDALSTDRRAARAPRLDKLVFSDNGSTLLGTTTRLNISATVVLSVPVFPAAENGVPTHAELREAWCTNILEPENINNSSHATFMRDNGRSHNERLFAWNAHEDKFGILSTESLEYNNVEFVVTISPPLSTVGGLGAAIHSVPAVDERGETAAMVVNERTIRLYVVPEVEDEHVKIEAHGIDHELDEEFGCPFTDIRWVYSHANLPAPRGDPSQVSGRLVLVSPGGITDMTLAEENVQDIEGGRIILFDFDPQFAGLPTQTFTLTLGKAPPQMLREQEMNVAQEIALVRKRTVNQGAKISQRAPVALGRSASTANRRNMQPPVLEQIRDESPSGSLQPSPVERQFSNAPGQMIGSDGSNLPQELGGDRSFGDTSDGSIEEPYNHNAPRSIVSLQRAASAANTHRIQQFQERRAETVYARENGNLPLPQYTEEANTPLPGRYRAMAGLEQPKMMPKATFSPQLDGRAQQTGEAAGFRPRLDSAQATIPEDSEGHFHATLAQPTSPDAFANGNMPRYLSRAYSNAAQSNPAAVQSNSPYQNGRQQWPGASPNPGQNGPHQVSPMTSLGSMRTPPTVYQPPVGAQSAIPQHIGSQNGGDGLGIRQEQSTTSSPQNRYDADREEIRRRLEQPDVQPSPTHAAYVPSQPIAMPAQHNGTFDSLLLPATSVSPDISRSQSVQPIRSRQQLPAHVNALQDTFQSSSSDAVSGFVQPTNPHRRHSAQASAGSIAHPILNWTPPGASQATSYQQPTTYQPSQPLIQPPSHAQTPSTPQRPSQSQIPPVPPIPQDTSPYPASRASHSNTSLQSLHRPSSAPPEQRSRDQSRSRLPSRAPSRTGTSAGRERSRSRIRNVFGGSRTPKHVYEGGDFVEEKPRRCNVM